MKILDLFSGIGGFSLAGKWAGCTTIQFVEIDAFCRKVLAKNFPGVPIHDDIKTFHYDGYVDILTAGFPCQPFSVAGKKQGRKDDRYLWPEVIRLIRECQPSWIILENVPGIVPHIDPILEDLEREGYVWEAYNIPASAVYAPHKRERIWIIANRDRLGCETRERNREKRYVQGNGDWYLEAIQSERSQFVPQSWKTFNAQEWLTPNADGVTGSQKYKNSSEEKITRERYCRIDKSDRFAFNWREDKPPFPRVDDGLPDGLDRNKALGNAIVPQIAYILINIICEIEQWHTLNKS